MAGRVRVSSGQTTWQAQVAGTRVTFSDTDETFVVTLLEDGRVQVDGDGGSISGIAARAGDRVWIGLGGVISDWTIGSGAAPAASRRLDHDAFAAPMAATVVRINVAAGDRVRDGDTLIALEAMKMELPIRAPRDGVVRAVHCVEGELVQQGAELVELEPVVEGTP